MTAQKTIHIAGAGLAGSLLALLMARRGFQVEVFEKRADLRCSSMSAGRSINLAISTRGLTALAKVGVKDDALKLALPMKGRLMHDVSSALTFQPYSANPHECINSISRGQLNSLLMDAAEASGRVKIHFNSEITEVNFTENSLLLVKNKNKKRIPFELVFGADGAGSVLRSAFTNQLASFREEVTDLGYGYKELSIPPNRDGSFLIAHDCLHIWPRQSFMLIALPNLDRSFTCTLFLPYQGEVSFAALTSAKKVTDFFTQYFPDALKIMPNLSEEFAANPMGHLATLRCSPWFKDGKGLILGDAAHAVVPFYGQGMNCAFESCVRLAELYDEHSQDGWQAVFAKFFNERKPNTDAIAAMAEENFIEMRDHVGNPHFLLKKQVGLALTCRFPNEFVPQYTLVTFRNVPYREALRCGRLQEQLLAKLCNGLSRVEEVDWLLAEQLVKDYKKQTGAAD